MKVSENTDLKDKVTNELLKGQAVAMNPAVNGNEGGYNIQTQDGLSFKDEFEKLLIEKTSEDADLLIGSIGINPYLQFNFEDYEIEETFKYDTKTIENVDAMFFLNISNQGESVNLKINDDLSVIDASNYKTMEVSKTLGDMILRASENNKSVRLDFDDHVTVVLKVSKDGKIDASFFPQNKEVENYLKNNIDYLKVRFDEQSIAYSNISYKPYKEPNKNNNNSKQGDKKWTTRM